MTAIVFKALPQFIRSRMEGRENLHGVLKNIGWLLVDRILRMGVGLVVGVWLARYLGSVQFGLFSYAIAFVTLFSAFSTLGIESIVIRDLVRDPACKQETLGTAFALRIGGAIVMYCLAVGGIFLLRSDDLTRTAVAIIAIGGFFQAFDTIDYWFQSQVQSKFTVYAKNSAFLLITLLRILLLVAKAPLIAFVLAAVAEALLGALGLMFFYNLKAGGMRSWRFSFERAKQLLANGWLLMLSGLVITLYMRIDQVMLGQMMGDHEVGIYSAAVRISEVWYFIPLAIVSSVFPSIVQTKTISAEVYSQRMQKLLTLMALLGYAVALLATFLSNRIVDFVFGSQYDGAGLSLMLLCWAGLFVSLGVARESWLITEGLMKFSFATTALGAICNIALNIVLIPRHGAGGAAIASLVSYAVAAYASCFLHPQTRPLAFMMSKALILRT